MSEASVAKADVTAAEPPEIEIVARDGHGVVDADHSNDESLPCDAQVLSVRIEALLFASDRPMPEGRLADLLGLSGTGRSKIVRAAIDELTSIYAATGRSFRPRKLSGGWQLMTLPVFGELMLRLRGQRNEGRLSPAALETLSIIAYRQPILRAEIEAIRGVACGEVLRKLMEKRLIKIAGRAEELGRPMLYGTTPQFLTVFGLANLDDLPFVEGLERTPSYRPPKPPKVENADGEDADGEDAVSDVKASPEVDTPATDSPASADSPEDASHV